MKVVLSESLRLRFLSVSKRRLENANAHKRFTQKTSKLKTMPDPLGRARIMNENKDPSSNLHSCYSIVENAKILQNTRS